MLPHPNDPEFPSALKTRRMLRGMSSAELAFEANIHSSMPRRYEDPNCNAPAKPSPEVWFALNKVLGYAVPTDINLDTWLMVGATPPPETKARTALEELNPSIEDILDFLERKNYEVSIYALPPKTPPPSDYIQFAHASPSAKELWFDTEIAKLRARMQNSSTTVYAFYSHSLKELKVAQKKYLAKNATRSGDPVSEPPPLLLTFE
ncbi:MAG: helix-turn-helix transcriptional regulator [Agitococcus sp.]|nr:helix-turn-helix transcriptional regulator [Agitococcus sp.]MDO9177640.1 helix-turn-helix transcriptional regulator [Agitococcus sp.]